MIIVFRSILNGVTGKVLLSIIDRDYTLRTERSCSKDRTKSSARHWRNSPFINEICQSVLIQGNPLSTEDDFNCSIGFDCKQGGGFA
jgi:hypothetical protein